MKKVLRTDMNGNILPDLPKRAYKPRAYIPGVIEEFIKEDRLSALSDQQTSEESKQLIKELYGL